MLKKQCQPPESLGHVVNVEVLQKDIKDLSLALTPRQEEREEPKSLDSDWEAIGNSEVLAVSIEDFYTL